MSTINDMIVSKHIILLKDIITNPKKGSFIITLMLDIETAI